MGNEAINNSIRLGIDSVEHGSYGDAASYKLYKEHGAYLVPTSVGSNLERWLPAFPWKQTSSEAVGTYQTCPWHIKRE